MKKRKTIGLVLGSGHFRGFAHIGIIKTLKKHNIPVDYIGGASVGALIAAHYAIFRDVKRLEEDFASNLSRNLPPFLDPSLTGGLLGGRRLAVYLENILDHRDFSALKIPLRIIATDLKSGQSFVFKQGDVGRAVLASLAVPLVFKPVVYKNKLLVDGALSNPIPGDVVRRMGADIVIGVNLYHPHEFVERKFTMTKVVLRSTMIVLHNLAKIAIKDADIVIVPDCSLLVKEQGFKKYFTREVVERLIKIGERAAEKMIPELKRLMAK